MGWENKELEVGDRRRRWGSQRVKRSQRRERELKGVWGNEKGEGRIIKPRGRKEKETVRSKV